MNQRRIQIALLLFGLACVGAGAVIHALRSP